MLWILVTSALLSVPIALVHFQLESRGADPVLRSGMLPFLYLSGYAFRDYVIAPLMDMSPPTWNLGHVATNVFGSAVGALATVLVIRRIKNRQLIKASGPKVF